MAGDWIKMRSSLLTNPKIKSMGSAIENSVTSNVTRNVTRLLRDVTLASLMRVWCAANEHTNDGVFKNCDLGTIDFIAEVEGFGAAMASVGWLIYDETNKTVTLPNFLENNAPAKNGARSTNAKRQAEYRERQKEKRNAERNVTRNVTGDVTRNVTSNTEKRREEVTNPIVPLSDKSDGSQKADSTEPNYSEAFLKFWSAYPTRRRTAKPKCFAVWKRNKLDSKAGLVMLDLRRKKSTEDWTKQGGEFVPAPLTYLNRGEYADAEPELPGMPRAKPTEPGEVSGDPLAIVGPEFIVELRSRFIDPNTIMGKQMIIERAKAIQEGKI